MKYKYIRIAELFISLRELGGGPLSYVKVGKTVLCKSNSDSDLQRVELSTYKNICYDQNINVLGSVNPRKAAVETKVTMFILEWWTNK